MAKMENTFAWQKNTTNGPVTFAEISGNCWDNISCLHTLRRLIHLTFAQHDATLKHECYLSSFNAGDNTVRFDFYDPQESGVVVNLNYYSQDGKEYFTGNYINGAKIYGFDNTVEIRAGNNEILSNVQRVVHFTGFVKQGNYDYMIPVNLPDLSMTSNLRFVSGKLNITATFNGNANFSIQYTKINE